MIDGPRRTALEEMYAARLRDERTLRCLRKYYMSVDPANFNDTVEPVPYYPGIDHALHEGYRWEPEKRPGQLIPLPTCSECGKRPVHVITDVFDFPLKTPMELKVCKYCADKMQKEAPPLNAYPNVDRATYPRWKLSSDWKRPSRWQRLRWRIRALCRRVGAWFRWGGPWWVEEDE